MRQKILLLSISVALAIFASIHVYRAVSWQYAYTTCLSRVLERAGSGTTTEHITFICHEIARGAYE